METLTKAQHGHQQSSDVVDFFCHAPEANSVFVAGTFNQWRPDVTPMLGSKEGEWTTSVSISPGHYGYKFVVDGQWCCEPGCEHEYRGCAKCVPNECNTMNRVLEVA